MDVIQTSLDNYRTRLCEKLSPNIVKATNGDLSSSNISLVVDYIFYSANPSFADVYAALNGKIGTGKILWFLRKIIHATHPSIVNFVESTIISDAIGPFIASFKSETSQAMMREESIYLTPMDASILIGKHGCLLPFEPIRATYRKQNFIDACYVEDSGLSVGSDARIVSGFDGDTFPFLNNVFHLPVESVKKVSKLPISKRFDMIGEPYYGPNVSLRRIFEGIEPVTVLDIKLFVKQIDSTIVRRERFDDALKDISASSEDTPLDRVQATYVVTKTCYDVEGLETSDYVDYIFSLPLSSYDLADDTMKSKIEHAIFIYRVGKRQYECRSHPMFR